MVIGSEGRRRTGRPPRRWMEDLEESMRRRDNQSGRLGLAEIEVVEFTLRKTVASTVLKKNYRGHCNIV